MRIKNLIVGLLAVFISIGGLCVIGIKEQPLFIKLYCQRQGGCGRRRERDHVWPRWFLPKHDSAQGVQFYGQTIPMGSLSIAHTINYFLVR